MALRSCLAPCHAAGLRFPLKQALAEAIVYLFLYLLQATTDQ
jgi:hypothetical protein